MSEMLGSPIEVLLVEDNPTDIELTQEAFLDAKMRIELHVVRDGVQAIDFLLQRDDFEEVPRPDLILLDLNLPRKDGRAVLEEVKKHDKLKAIPIVILTTSKASEDVIRAYNLHANCYITKPLNFARFCEVVKSIENFWFTVVKLPNPSDT